MSKRFLLRSATGGEKCRLSQHHPGTVTIWQHRNGPLQSTAVSWEPPMRRGLRSCSHATSPVLLALWFRSTRARGGWLRAVMNRLDYRSWFAAMGIGLHIGIHLLMNIGPFGLITLAIYPALWHPDEWRSLRFRRVPRRRSAPPSQSAGPVPPAE